MTLLEAAKQALEALDGATKTTAFNNDQEYHYLVCCGSMLGRAHMSDCKESKALNDLRAAIEEAENKKHMSMNDERRIP